MIFYSEGTFADSISFYFKDPGKGTLKGVRYHDARFKEMESLRPQMAKWHFQISEVAL